MMDMEVRRGKIRGCLLGGAAGDALGYPVEFMFRDEILSRFGREGIRNYYLDMKTGFAEISDDTQMTLFTANGLLTWEARLRTQNAAGSVRDDLYGAYLDWLRTQTGGRESPGHSWLLNLPELHSLRAPGGTCLSALGSGRCGTIESPLNDRKGCGGIMRAAPVGLFFDPASCGFGREEIDRIGAESAAITHGHSLGYIPAAVLTHIVNVAVYGGCPRGDTLADAVEDAMDAAEGLFGRDPHWPELRALMNQAEALAKNDRADADNIRDLGEGWVAEETLAISVYCALRHPDDFSAGIIAAVNHDGDSDSTGAVTGNILGSWLGIGAIEERWTRNLELRKILLEMADDLTDGCPPDGDSSASEWTKKYVEGRYPA